MRLNALLATLTALTVLAGGCGDEPTGVVVVEYQIGPGSASCQSYGIVTVRARLQAPDRDPIVQETRCENPGSIIINNVPVDVYAVAVEGLDPNGDIIYEGAATGLSVVEGTSTSSDLVRLMSLPARLGVGWRFSNGNLCLANNVETIEVWFYDEDGNPDYVEGDCNIGYLEIENLTNPPYDLRVRGIDMTSGEYAWAYDSDGIQLQAGTITDVAAILEPCPTECVP